MNMKEARNKLRVEEDTTLAVMRKYPRLTAHVICESLGYFTPKSAAIAIRRYIENETFACEWYSSMAYHRTKDFFDRKALLEINREVLEAAARNRHTHKGYMREYQVAMKLVQREIESNGHTPTMLASWF